MTFAEAPERCDADMSALCGKLFFQLRQRDVACLDKRRVDQDRVRFRPMRQAISAQALGTRVAHGSTKRRPADPWIS